MDELKKINNNIMLKQIKRGIIGPVAMVIGMVLIEKFAYQKGITDYQRALMREFPDEYSAMTEKVINVLKKDA